jgi:hypothetical protein
VELQVRTRHVYVEEGRSAAAAGTVNAETALATRPVSRTLAPVGSVRRRS